MNAWFSPEIAPWFSFLSLFALLATVAPLAQKGKYKTLVTGVYGSAIALGLAFLIVTGLALSSAQPLYVFGPFLLTGTLLTVVFVATFPGMRRAYRDAENRKIIATNM